MGISLVHDTNFKTHIWYSWDCVRTSEVASVTKSQNIAVLILHRRIGTLVCPRWPYPKLYIGSLVWFNLIFCLFIYYSIIGIREGHLQRETVRSRAKPFWGAREFTLQSYCECRRVLQVTSPSIECAYLLMDVMDPKAWTTTMRTFDKGRHMWSATPHKDNAKCVARDSMPPHM